MRLPCLEAIMNIPKVLSILLSLSVITNLILFAQLNKSNPANLEAPVTRSSTLPLQPTQAQQVTTNEALIHQLMNNLLQANDCQAAADILMLHTTDALSASIHSQWQETITHLIELKHHTHASQCLNIILNLYPYDARFNWLYGDLYASQAQFDDALSAFFHALPMSDNTEWVEQHSDKLHRFIMKHFQTLQEMNDWQGINTFFSQVLSLDSSNVFYQLIHAESLFQLAQFEESKVWLLPLINNEHVGLRAQQLLAKIEARNMPNMRIPLQRIGEQYLVSVAIDSQPATLLIDTGASISLLTQQKYQQILNTTAPVFIRETQLQTAGGIISAPIFEFEKLAVGQIQQKKPQLVIVDLAEMSHFDGLLGMDFFSRFHFTIDQKNNQLLLSPIEATLAELD